MQDRGIGALRACLPAKPHWGFLVSEQCVGEELPCTTRRLDGSMKRSGFKWEPKDGGRTLVQKV